MPHPQELEHLSLNNYFRLVLNLNPKHISVVFPLKINPLCKNDNLHPYKATSMPRFQTGVTCWFVDRRVVLSRALFLLPVLHPALSLCLIGSPSVSTSLYILVTTTTWLLLFIIIFSCLFEARPVCGSAVEVLADWVQSSYLFMFLVSAMLSFLDTMVGR